MDQPDSHSRNVTGSYDPALLPEFCDFSCAYASFAAEDAVGACRREVGVYCSVLSSYINKHSKCQVRRTAGATDKS